MEHYLKDSSILFVMTVCTVPKEESVVHGLFIGEGRDCLTAAIELAVEKNVEFVERGIRKCVA